MAAALQPPALAPAAPSQQEFVVPCQAVWGRAQAPTARSASHCHPVFFTDKLRRLPFALGAAPHASPVAHGYAYRDAPRSGGKATGPRL